MSNMTQLLGSNPLVQAMMQKGIPLSALAQQTPSSTNFQPDMQIPPYPVMPQRSPVAGVASALQQPAAPQPSISQMSFQAPGLPNPTMVKTTKPTENTISKKATGDESIMRVLANALHNLTKLAVGNQDAQRSSNNTNQ